MNTTDTVSGCGRWFLYLLACGDGSLYCGICTDPARRLGEHRSGRGARYTRSCGAGEMRLIGCCFDRSAALRAEARVKKLPRQAKLALWAAAESRAVAAA